MKHVRAFLALLVAGVLCLSLLAGCGNAMDTSTPDGTLKSMLTAVKNGDYQAMQELSGESLSSDPEDADLMKSAGELVRVFFQNVDVEVSLKDSDETRAIVTVQGKTSDLSALGEDMAEEFQKEVSVWALENMDRLIKLSTEEMQKETIKVMTPILKKYIGELPQKEVQAEVIMTKNSAGRWVVSENSSSDMMRILFGTSDEVDIGSLLAA